MNKFSDGFSTADERVEMEDMLIDSLIEDMDMSTLISFARDALFESYSQYSDHDLLEEVERFAPHLLDEDDEYDGQPDEAQEWFDFDPDAGRLIMFNLDMFTSPRNENSLFKNIPMNCLDEVKSVFKTKGIKVRYRYRGPRNEFSDIRPKHRRMQDCVKQFANRFSVYLR